MGNPIWVLDTTRRIMGNTKLVNKKRGVSDKKTRSKQKEMSKVFILGRLKRELMLKKKLKV